MRRSQENKDIAFGEFIKKEALLLLAFSRQAKETKTLSLAQQDSHL